MTVRVATSDDDLATLVAINDATTPDEPTTLDELRWADATYPGTDARLGYEPLPDEIMMRGPLVGGGA